jgi:hypothetical protein
MGDQKIAEKPQTQQQPGQQQEPGQKNQAQQQRPGQQQQQQQPTQASRQGGDQGKVGQDTDGDGKVVKPGQPPGQSGGEGLDK